MSLLFKIFISLSLISAFLLPNFSLLAEEATSSNSTMIPSEERKALEAELKILEEQLSKIDEDISKTESEKNTLKNQIYLLKKKIEKLDLQIKQDNTIIKDLGLQIGDTENSIDQTSLKIGQSQKQLATILQTIYEEEQKSLIEILLSEEELSDFFDDLIALEALNSKNQELLENIKNLKSYLEKQKQSLDEEKADLERVVKIQILQREESKGAKTEQEQILKLTEAQYQKYLKDKEEAQKRAAEIRARIFELIGVPKAPTFGEAYEIAKYVETITGVKPALLLAVMTQESNIGKNVGQCYLKNLETGSGVKVNGQAISKVMNPSRDIPLFLEITKELGRDFFNTPVSCPIASVGGYGGAMGPAQFIPSTWNLYKNKVTAITGKAADPWNIKDAFLAAGLYLRDLGASTDEFKAVMRYFSGSSWSKWEEFYGRTVLIFATQYEKDIKEIEEVS